MDNNIINNGGGLKLQAPQEVTLPYTATRDCFFIITETDNESGKWYIYFNLNGVQQDRRCRFGGYTPSSSSATAYMVLQKGDTLSIFKKDSEGTYKFYVM